MATPAKISAELSYGRLTHLGRLVLLHTAIVVRDYPNIPNREQLFISLSNYLNDVVAEELVENLDPYGWGNFLEHQRAARNLSLDIGGIIRSVGGLVREHIDMPEESIPW